MRLRAEVLTGMELQGARGRVELSLQGGWPRLVMSTGAPTLTLLSAEEWERRRAQLT